MINKIPPEILGKIFEHCLPETGLKDAAKWTSKNVQYGHKSAPLLMCHVSPRWRAVAKAHNKLWRVLKVCVLSGKSYPSIETAAIWIADSGTIPLTLELHQEDESVANRKAAGKLLELFIGQFHRWGSVRLNIASPEYEPSAMLQSQEAPFLETLLVRNYKGCPSDPANERRCLFNPWSFLQAAPILTNLHVGWMPGGEDGQNTSAPWSRLSRLSCDDVPSIKMAMGILNKCDGLRDCAFAMEGVGSTALEVEEAVHKTLRTLRLSINWEQLMPFLAQLTLPALEELTIQITGALIGGWWPQTIFEGLLVHSGCRLKRLELYNTGMSSDQLEACVKHPATQILEELVIDDQRDWTWDPLVNDSLLQMLTITKAAEGEETEKGEVGDREQAADFMPKLERLSLQGTGISTTDGAIATMVESRVQHGREGFGVLRQWDISLPESNTQDYIRLEALRSL